MTTKPNLGALFGAGESNTFLGLPSYTESKEVSASSVFIGARGATPYGSVGSYCRNAPSALRKSIASLCHCMKLTFQKIVKRFTMLCRR